MKPLEKRLRRIETARPTGTTVLDDTWPIADMRGQEAPADIWGRILAHAATAPRHLDGGV